MSNCNNNSGGQYNTSGRRFNRFDINAYGAGGNAEQSQNSSNNTTNSSCGQPSENFGAGERYNTSGRRFNRFDINAYGNAEQQQNFNTSGFSQNHSCSQNMSNTAPGGRYNSSGRALNRADLNAFAVNTSNLIAETCSPDDSSYNQSRGAANQSSRASNLSQSAPLGRHIDHEEEMARNQQKALNRLRAEQTQACRSALSSKRAPQTQTNSTRCKPDAGKSGSCHGQAFNPQDEICQPKTKENAGSPKKGRNVMAGRRLDVKGLVEYNIQSCETQGGGGRRLCSPKGQRATSCPTPMPSIAQCSSLRPRFVTSTPIRSANTTRSNSPNCPNTALIPTNARCPATPTICPPTPDGVNVNVTMTTRTTAPPIRNADRQNNSPPRNGRPNAHLDTTYGAPPRTGYPPLSPLGTPLVYPSNVTPQPTQPSLQNTYNTNNSGQPQSPHGNTRNESPLNSTTPNSPYGPTYSPANPPTPPYRSSRLNFVPIDNPDALSSSDMIKYMQYHADFIPLVPRTKPTYSDALRDSFLLDASYEDNDPDPSLYPNMINNNRCSPSARTSQCPAESFVDLTNDTVYDSPSTRQRTQYGNQTMEISNGPGVSRNSNGRTPPPNMAGTGTAGSWPIPQTDMTCNDGNNSNGNASFCPADLLEPELNYEQRHNNYLLNQSCPAEVQTGSSCPPRASLFRCLAKKLSSTYDFLSSFVTNSEPKSQQECSSSPMDCSSGQNSCPYSSLNDTTMNYGLERLFETQPNPNATTGTPGSLRECANAKRCGRVQFDDGSDQPQDPQQKAVRQAQIESLVSDNYCPGLIQATVDGTENFNNIAFNITLGKDAKDTSKCDRPPPLEPITLLEAFSMRIDRERETFNKQLPKNVAADQILDIIDKQFADKYPTDCNRSIKSLLLSERTKEHEQVEQAKEKSFNSDVQKVRTSFPDNPQIKLDVYTGHTNPSND